MNDYVVEAESLADLSQRRARRFAGVMVALALGVLALMHYGVSRDLLVPLLGLNVLVAISITDLESRRIPNRILLPAWAVTLAANCALHPSRALEWTLCSLAAGAFFLVFARVSGGGLGMGDVKLAAFLGALLGRDVLLALVIGTVASAILAGAIWLRHGSAGWRRTYPLGPFLAAGGIILLLLS